MTEKRPRPRPGKLKLMTTPELHAALREERRLRKVAEARVAEFEVQVVVLKDDHDVCGGECLSRMNRRGAAQMADVLERRGGKKEA